MMLVTKCPNCHTVFKVVSDQLVELMGAAGKKDLEPSFPQIILMAGLQVGGSSRVVTAYLPEELAKKLPMFERFKVKAIGEVCLSEDRYEAASTAFKVLVVGRVASAPGGRR